MDRRVTREALRLMESHEPFVRATVVRAVGSVPGKLGASMLLRSNGSTMGTIGGAALEERVRALAKESFDKRESGLHHFDLRSWQPGGLPSLCGGEVDIAVEFVAPRPRVLLWGGGHVAEAVAKLLPSVEYDYVVADDRPEWVSEDRFPDAERRIVVPPSKLFSEVEPGSFSHLYVLGYDAHKDLEVLENAIRAFPGTIGLIASASKRTRMFADLARRGVGPADVARIRSPVGLPIGAQSPAEIAVSIAAEIVRDARSGTTAKNPVVSPPSDG